MTATFNEAVLKQSLKELFKPDGHFSICKFDAILTLAQITVTKAERLPFDALHCVSYRDMEPALQRELIHKVSEILQRGPSPIFKLAELLDAHEKATPVVELRHSFLQRLLR